MIRDMLECAADLDDGPSFGRLSAIAMEAKRHGMRAVVISSWKHSPRGYVPHVLVTSPDGAILATRSAVRLAHWLGY